jgi:hypothetical protein
MKPKTWNSARKTTEKLHFFPEPTWGFVMHPSGKRMAFTQSRTNYELWVRENFLPAVTASR